MKAIGYINSNRSHEIDKEIDLKIQHERIVEYCKLNNISLSGVLYESKDSRVDYKPTLINLLNVSKKKNFNKLIMLKKSVLGEDNELIKWVNKELYKNEVSIIYLVEDEHEPVNSNENVLLTYDITDKAEEKAKSIQEKLKELPSLPEVVTKVMELVQNPNSSAAQLGKIISHDPGLTSRVLKLVNSAYYGFPKQISSIQHAIMILGFTTMRGLVLSSSIFKVFAPKPGQTVLDYKLFWKHSLLTAISAKIIYKYMLFEEDEDLFSSAILHDIGKIILDQYDHQNYSSVISSNIPKYDYTQLIKNEEKFCTISHCNIGFLVSDSWNLPNSISDSIRYHHDPMQAESKNVKLVSVVYLANILAHINLHNEAIVYNNFNLEVLNYLGLNETSLYEINTLIKEEISDTSELESFIS